MRGRRRLPCRERLIWVKRGNLAAKRRGPPFTQNREPPTFWWWEQPMRRKKQSAKRPRWMFFALPRLLPSPTAAKGALAEGVGSQLNVNRLN
jgi:hypothetical protein